MITRAFRFAAVVCAASALLRAQAPVILPVAIPALPSDRDVADLALRLRWISPGSFDMGSPSGGEDDERPVARVTITQGYWLGATEVTQKQWTALMGTNPSITQGESLPVAMVRWTDAMEFCAKLTQREQSAGRLPAGFAFTLPTEAQWEFACRAGTTGDYSENLDQMGWYTTNSKPYAGVVGRGEVKTVATKQPNAWGLYDMHGNVWEWCLDWYGPYPRGATSDPAGPLSGTFRVVRGGGAWTTSAPFARSANRNWWEPGYRTLDLGFRIALSPVRQVGN